MGSWTTDDVPSIAGRTRDRHGRQQWAWATRRPRPRAHGATVIMALPLPNGAPAALLGKIRSSVLDPDASVHALDLADLSPYASSPPASRVGSTSWSTTPAAWMAIPRREQADGFEMQVRHQPPRPLRGHRAPVAGAPEAARRPGGDGEQHRGQHRAHQLRQPPAQDPLQPVGNQPYGQAGQPVVQPRARSAGPGGRRRPDQRCRPSRLRGHQPPVRCGRDPGLDHGARQRHFAQSAAAGALPALYAASGPDVVGGTYYGPGGPGGIRAIPARLGSSGRRDRRRPPAGCGMCPRS